MPLRAGVGYDIHRKLAGRRLILGGVEFQGERGLDGHSDADVLLHAIGDALLGALALGDLGDHFPPSDPKWKDASSLDLLRSIYALVTARGAKVVNIDATVIAESPKLSTRRDEMRANIANALGISIETVSIKATTQEGLGALGRDEGIAAWAVAMVETS